MVARPKPVTTMVPTLDHFLILIATIGSTHVQMLDLKDANQRTAITIPITQAPLVITTVTIGPHYARSILMGQPASASELAVTTKLRCSHTQRVRIGFTLALLMQRLMHVSLGLVKTMVLM